MLTESTLQITNMNEQAIQDAYTLFKSKGYSKSIDEFKTLMQTNENAVQDAYTLFTSKGYSKSIDDFKELMGASGQQAIEEPAVDAGKKKDEFVESSSQEVDTELDTREEEEPISLASQLADDDPFKESLRIVNPDLIDREEEEVVNRLRYQFQDYGFQFEERGIGDAMKVTAKNGETINIDLDPFRRSTEVEQSKLLNDFLIKNRDTKAKGQWRIASDEEQEEMITTFDDKVKDFRDEIKRYKEASLEVAKREQDWRLKPEGYRLSEQGKNEWQYIQLNKQDLESRSADIVKKSKEFEAEGANLDRLVGEYVSMKAEEGTWAGGIWNSLMKGIGRMSSDATNKAIDALTWILPDSGMSPEQYKSEVIRLAQERGVELPEGYEDMTNEELIEELGDDGDSIDAKITDLARKATKYYDSYEEAVEGRFLNPYSKESMAFDNEEGMLAANRKGMLVALGDDDTTAEWIDTQQQGFWGGAILGLAESIPAMVGGKGAVGFAQRTAQMMALTSDHVYEEMQHDPDFDNISENEKAMVAAPIAVAVGTLEALGFRNLVAKKGLLNGIVARSLGKSAKGTSMKTFAQFVKEDVTNLAARGLLTAGGAALAEFETGAAQEVAEVGVKYIYNQIKDKEMFQTPEDVKQFVGQVLRAGAQEAVGGFIMGTPAAVSSMLKGNKTNEMTDEMMSVVEELVKDKKFTRLHNASLVRKVISGELTKEEAEQQKQDLYELDSLLSQIPEEYTAAQKKEAIQLLYNKKQIENEIAGKDKSLTKKQAKKIAEIDARLEELAEPQTEEEAATQEEAKGMEELIGDEEIVTEKKMEETVEEKVDEAMEEKAEGTTPETSTSKYSLPDVDKLIAEGDMSETTEADTPDGAPLRDAEGNIIEDQPRRGTNTFSNSTGTDFSSTTVKDIFHSWTKAPRIVKALARVAPKVRVINHYEESEFKKYTGTEGKAYYDPEQNVIHLNGRKADRTSLAHEAFHAILLNSVRTEAGAQEVSRKIVDALGRALPKNHVILQKAKAFAQEYQEGQQNEEVVAELIGLLSAEMGSYRNRVSSGTLKKSALKKLVDAVKQLLNSLGIDIDVSQINEENEIIDMLNTINEKMSGWQGKKFVGGAQEITSEDIAWLEQTARDLEDGAPAPMGAPTTLGREQQWKGEEIEFPEQAGDLSFVTKNDMVDFDALVNDIIEKGQKVWFWMGDQLGRGYYFDEVINDNHYLDAGPSYALDPANRDRGAIWASGADPKTLGKYLEQADYIFFTSGSPQKAKLFNKQVFKLVGARIEESMGGYQEFIKALKKTKRSGMRDSWINVLSQYNSFEEAADSTMRKTLLNILETLAGTKTTPKGSLKELMTKANAFINVNELRDSFFKNNNFEMNDIMLIVKPTSLGGIAPHSTYQTEIMGEVVGVPNKRVNAWEMMPKKTREAKTKKGDELSPAMKMKIIAAEAGVVRPLQGRQQKTVGEVVREGRANGYKDATIRDYLVRVRKIAAKIVDEALVNDVRPDTEVPASFKNIKAGAQAGIELYNRVEAYMVKLGTYNRRRKEENKRTRQEIIDETIEFMMRQPEYQAEADTRTVGSKKKGTQKTVVMQDISTQQAKMQAELQKQLGFPATQDMAAQIQLAKAKLKQRAKGARDLNAKKQDLVRFIRKTLPAHMYSRRDVVSMLNKIIVADEHNLPNLFQEVIDLVNQKNSRNLARGIKNLLNGKYVKRDGKLMKGAKVDVTTQERIRAIKKMIVSPNAEAADVHAKNQELSQRYNELANEPNPTEQELNEMADIHVAMDINTSALMQDNELNKVMTLARAHGQLEELIEEGRTALKDEISKDQEKYRDEFNAMYEDITQEKIDKDDREGLENAMRKRGRKAENEGTNMAGRDALRANVLARTKGAMRTIHQWVNLVFNSAEALDGLMDKISMLGGEMFGGVTQEIVTDKVDKSSRRFKERKMAVDQLIGSKLEELYGKDWQKIARRNRGRIPTGIMNDPEAVAQAKEAMEKNPTWRTKKAYKNTVKENELVLSINQMGYLYNQYKDPANRNAFEAKYGEEHVERIMAAIESHLDKNAPKAKAFYDWQVEELFPQLYQEYNKAYRELYKTNMPWNEFYSGRLYREGEIEMELDLLGDANTLNTVVGAASTKVRQHSNKKIVEMDGMDALMSYVHDMEYFAAYGKTIKDINRLFSNQYISAAIKDIHGSGVMKLIQDSVQKIANKGVRNSFLNSAVNSMHTVFILSRLAISPVVMIKQLTSFITYANSIGVMNWMKHGTMNLAQMRSVYKEIKENSVYMKDRKDESILRAIESYGNTSRDGIGLSKTAKQKLIDVAMWTTKFGDRTAIYMGGMANYSYYKAEFKKNNPQATEQEAIDYAVAKFEKDTKRTQQSSDLQDKDFFQTSHPMMRAANMFLTTPKQYLRKEIQAVRSMNRKAKALIKGGPEGRIQAMKDAGKGTLGQNLRTLMMYHVMLPAFFQYVTLGLPGLLRRWRDEDDDDMYRSVILGNLNALFILGEAMTMAGDFFTNKPYAGEQTKSIPLLQWAQSLTRHAKRATNAKKPETQEKHWKKFYLELASGSGLPAQTLDKFKTNYGKVIDGDTKDSKETILRLLNYSEFMISGPEKKEKKKKKSGGGRKLSDKEMKELFPDIYQMEKDMEEEMMMKDMEREQADMEKELKQMEEDFKEMEREMLGL